MRFGEKVRYIWNLWRPHRGFWAFLAVLTLVSTAVTVAYPLALKVVIDRVEAALRSGNAPRLGSLFALLALVWVGRFVAGFYPAFRAWMNLRIENDIRAEAFARVLEKDYRFQRAFRTGDVVTRLTDDVGEYTRIAWFSCSGIFRAVDSGAKLVFSVAAMVALEPRLAALSILPLPIVLVAFYKVQRRFGALVQKQQEAISRTNEVLESAFSGIKIVKAFSAEEGQRKKLRAILSERVPVQLSLMKAHSLFQTVEALAARAGQVVALAVGGVLVARGEVAFGTIYAFYMYLDMLIHPMQDLPNLLVTARQAFVSVDRIEEMRRFPAPAPASVAAPRASAPAPAPDGIAIALRDVSFAYEGALAPALDRVSLEVRRGERLAVVGAVASGKTTLVRLLAHLVAPDAGEARLVPRERIGYVPQDSQLFSESIRENVGLGRADGAAIDRALAVAQLRDDLARFERGADTVLGEKGALVSGGQRQRIAIARALAREPEVLLLDDATASLDARSEERFWADLDAAHPGLTTVVTTHRVATVRRADRVCFLERGRVVDCGMHAELLARCRAYCDLLATEARAESLAASAAAG